MDEIIDERGDGQRLADALEDGITQLVAGTLLKSRAVEAHLEAGRIGEARRLMQEVRATQQDILVELRRLGDRLVRGRTLSP